MRNNEKQWEIMRNNEKNQSQFFSLFRNNICLHSLNFVNIWSLGFGVRGCIFGHAQPFCEQAVSDLDRSMHRSLWVQVAHSSFIEGSLMTKNTASGAWIKYKWLFSLFHILIFLVKYLEDDNKRQNHIYRCYLMSQQKIRKVSAYFCNKNDILLNNTKKNCGYKKQMPKKCS